MHFIGASPLALAVSNSVYIRALAATPFGLPANSQFLRLCSTEYKRKNWLFHDSVKGAQASAVIHSLSETAKLNNLRPYHYFKHLLTEFPKLCDDEGNIDSTRLDHLLPWSTELPKECRKLRR